ncbi:MAG TPA: hypothetical protein VI365_13035 [Trebonia sp.]
MLSSILQNRDSYKTCDLVVADHHQPGKLRWPRYAGGLRNAFAKPKSTAAASSSATVRRRSRSST